MRRIFSLRNSHSLCAAVLAAFWLTACTHGTTQPQPATKAPAATDERPNILLLVGDDMGFGDIEPFGSEIPTPTLNSLAEQGVRFSNFHSSPVCSVTRGMLLTGADNIQVGLGSFDYAVYHGAAGKAGYEGYLTRNAATISEQLQKAGYNTYHVGKWHLGASRDGGWGPHEWGFDRTYGLHSGGNSHWNSDDMVADQSDPVAVAAMKEGKVPPRTQADFFENGKPVERPEGVYSDDLYTDKMIEYIDEGHANGQPFFAYVAFTTAHFPIQAPAELIDPEAEKRYAELGYEGLKKERFARMQKLGTIPETAQFPSKSTLARTWESQVAEDRKEQARIYATFAGMIRSQDRSIQRILDHLEKLGELDNTLIVYMTDNGPEGGDADGALANKAWTDWAHANFSQKLEDIGGPDSSRQIGDGWANASTGALQWWKWFVAEGGVRVPMIMVAPRQGEGQPEAGKMSAQALSVKDIPATILDFAGVAPVDGEFEGRKVVKPSGVSLRPVLNGQAERVRGGDDWFAFELFGNKFVIDGDYKAIRVREGMYNDSQWHLYDIVQDPGEMVPLEAEQPERLRRMIGYYDDWAKRNNVIPVEEDWDPFTVAH